MPEVSGTNIFKVQVREILHMGEKQCQMKICILQSSKKHHIKVRMCGNIDSFIPGLL